MTFPILNIFLYASPRAHFWEILSPLNKGGRGLWKIHRWCLVWTLRKFWLKKFGVKTYCDLINFDLSFAYILPIGTIVATSTDKYWQKEIRHSCSAEWIISQSIKIHKLQKNQWSQNTLKYDKDRWLQEWNITFTGNQIKKEYFSRSLFQVPN